MQIKLTDEFLALNPRWNRREQQLIIKSLLNKISLTTKRSDVVLIKLKKFGTIRTHGNKKKMNRIKRSRKNNKKYWAETKQDRLTNIHYLLY